jgi:ribonuclease J
MDQFRHLNQEEMVILTTGSQGEPTSALVRIANGEHRDVQITTGDTIILSSTPIPGNEVVVTKTIDNLFRQGAEVFYDKVALVHVHGHASQEELKLMINLTRPNFFVPVHGAHRHLIAHSRLAHNQGIPKENIFVLEDGDVLELSDKNGEVVDHVQSGHIYIKGKHTWDMKSSILRDRQALSRDGMVAIMLAVDKKGRLIKRPIITSSGFIGKDDPAEILERTAETIFAAISKEDGSVIAQAKQSARTFLYKETGRRPIILPMTVEV